MRGSALRARSIAAALAILAAFAFPISFRAGEGDFRPVTDAMLRTPGPGDWINWRRTLDASGYSPLRQITRDNVSRLHLAWSWSMMQPGSNQPSPLVYDGVLYLPNPGGIQALDGATGVLKWEYRRPVSKRNIAIYDDKIIATTNDAHVIAVDARTGALAGEPGQSARGRVAEINLF